MLLLLSSLHRAVTTLIQFIERKTKPSPHLSCRLSELGLDGQRDQEQRAMGDGSGFPGFHSQSYDREYSRPLFRVASFSDSGDEQERHAPSPRGRSQSMSRTASSKVAAPSRLSSSSGSKMSLKKLQQVVDEKSMEDEGNGSLPVLPDVRLRCFSYKA